MCLVTSWALLVCRTQNASHEGTACGKVWEFSKFSSHKSSNISHSVLQLLKKLLSLSCFTVCYSCRFLEKFSALITYGVPNWSSVASLPLALDLMELLRKWFLAVASFNRLEPHHNTEQLQKLHGHYQTCAITGRKENSCALSPSDCFSHVSVLSSWLSVQLAAGIDLKGWERADGSLCGGNKFVLFWVDAATESSGFRTSGWGGLGIQLLRGQGIGKGRQMSLDHSVIVELVWMWNEGRADRVWICSDMGCSRIPLNPHRVGIFVAVPTTDCQMAWTQPLSDIQAVPLHGHGLKASLSSSGIP